MKCSTVHTTIGNKMDFGRFDKANVRVNFRILVLVDKPKPIYALFSNKKRFKLKSVLRCFPLFRCITAALSFQYRSEHFLALAFNFFIQIKSIINKNKNICLLPLSMSLQN